MRVEVPTGDIRILHIKGTLIESSSSRTAAIHVPLSLCISFHSTNKQVQFVEKVLAISRKQIHHLHHGVRVECLKLIGLLSHLTDDTEMPLSILEDNCHDADPRVRTAACQALVRML